LGKRIKMETTKFCTGCGNGLIETAVMCPKCGTPVARLRVAGSAALKKRSNAILLAVFLGYWTYLYTFAKDKTKFFIFLVAYSVSSAITMFTISFAIEQGFKRAWCLWDYGYDSTMCEIYEPNYAGTFIGIAMMLGIYIFIIVDRVKKTEDYYANYPN